MRPVISPVVQSNGLLKVLSGCVTLPTAGVGTNSLMAEQVEVTLEVSVLHAGPIPAGEPLSENHRRSQTYQRRRPIVRLDEVSASSATTASRDSGTRLPPNLVMAVSLVEV